jgi:ribonuclease T2
VSFNFLIRARYIFFSLFENKRTFSLQLGARSRALSRETRANMRHLYSTFVLTISSLLLLQRVFAADPRLARRPPRLSLRDATSDNGIVSSSSSSSSSCPNEGLKTHDGCDDPMFTKEANGDESDRFDMFELARSWTPGFCASSSKFDEDDVGAFSAQGKGKKKTECEKTHLKNEMTVHGLWPSYSEPLSDPVVASSRTGKEKKCYWPQNCRAPPGYPRNESFRFDEKELPEGEEFERLAPAWYYDGLAEHEWEKHGTCATWPARDTASVVNSENNVMHPLTQKDFYAGMFQLAKDLGTPEKLARSAGTKISLDALKNAFSEMAPAIAAFGCDSRCNFIQVVQCFRRPSSSSLALLASDRNSSSSDFIGHPMDCPCVGVRDSRYDNSCESHCADGVFIVDAAER